MKIKIDKNIPIPHKHYLCECKYPFNKLKIGDSFIVPKTVKDASIRTSATQFGKRHNMKFITRTVENGLRIWRTK